MSYITLSNFYRQIHQLSKISRLLRWDAQTMMPIGSAPNRADDIALLAELEHNMLASDQLGDLIAGTDTNSLDVWQKANVREISRARGNALAVETRLVRELAKATSTCEVIWREARKQNNFKMLLPSLKTAINLTREMAASKAAYFDVAPYDALIDIYDPGRKAHEIEKITNDLAGFLPEFIQQVMAHQTPALSFGDQVFPVAQQQELSVFCATRLGFNLNRGRIDVSAHPFCGGHSRDIRITTRYNESYFLSGLSALAHETGHALYEQNLPDEHQDQIVGNALWMSIHESQSLLVEKHISISYEFFEFIHQKVLELFNVSGSEYSPANLYKLATHVQPSLIRVGSDEITYPAHIILRFNLEKEIVAGNLQVEDIPQAWSEQMQAMLGIKPDTDADGCMQDIHWPKGYFGYFPTYLLGSILASQFLAQIKNTLGDVKADIRQGNFSRIIGWLAENIHSRGRSLTVSEVVTKATGRDIDVNCYKNYLRTKYLTN